MPDGTPLPIDAHCHLSEVQNLDPQLLEWKGKLKAIFSCGYSQDSSLAELRLANENPGFVFAIAGESPQRVMGKPEPSLEWLQELTGIVAIGEIGLDRHWAKEERQIENQKKWFAAQLELAEGLGLPVVIHSRDAESECLDILEKAGASKVLLHCFSGTPEEARRGMELGYSITVPPGNWKTRRKVIKAVEPDYLMLESDAPYLGKTPVSVLESAGMISKEKGITLEEAIRVAARNASKFYGVD
jgi:TatD DNase family protein